MSLVPTLEVADDALVVSRHKDRHGAAAGMTPMRPAAPTEPICELQEPRAPGRDAVGRPRDPEIPLGVLQVVAGPHVHRDVALPIADAAVPDDLDRLFWQRGQSTAEQNKSESDSGTKVAAARRTAWRSVQQSRASCPGVQPERRHGSSAALGSFSPGLGSGP